MGVLFVAVVICFPAKFVIFYVGHSKILHQVWFLESSSFKNETSSLIFQSNFFNRLFFIPLQLYISFLCFPKGLIMNSS